MIRTINNRKGFYTESKVLENIKESVDNLKTVLNVENGYEDEFINEVQNSFEEEYDQIMNSNVEEVFDMLENGSLNFDYKYRYDDFNYDEDVINCYLDVIDSIIDYSLCPIEDMKKTLNGYDIKFENGEEVSVAFRPNYTITTPLKELYDKHINLDNDIENKPSLKL